MIRFKLSTLTLEIALLKKSIDKINCYFNDNILIVLIGLLIGISINFFIFYYINGLGLAYNDARSHLDIGRRVVEGLKPGLAQLGSVWLPLPHALMIPTIWNDFMWHSGLSGSLQSMISFVLIGILIYKLLEVLGVGVTGKIFGVLIFITNLNILYLQSIAMTELLLLSTTTAAAYQLILFAKHENALSLIKASFFIMLASLIRYEGWFLLILAAVLLIIILIKRRGYQVTEGLTVLFLTLGGFGIFLWFGWNLVIFKDPLYFIFGPFSAAAQQHQLEQAGVLVTKGNWLFSTKIYLYAVIYNAGAFTVILGLIGAILFIIDKNIKAGLRMVGTLSLFSPLLFNILALYIGHSVLFIQGLSGDTWFNVRYGSLMLPTIAIFIGYLINRLSHMRYTVILLLVFVTFFSLVNGDAVTIDDARVGSSQKNVSEVSGWLKDNAGSKKGFILISAASHDAIIFSSGLPMKRFIHEGTGSYWESATTTPDRWARFIVMRTNDLNDLTFAAVSKTPAFPFYSLVASYPFADVYELKNEYLPNLITESVNIVNLN